MESHPCFSGVFFFYVLITLSGFVATRYVSFCQVLFRWVSDPLRSISLLNCHVNFHPATTLVKTINPDLFWMFLSVSLGISNAKIVLVPWKFRSTNQSRYIFFDYLVTFERHFSGRLFSWNLISAIAIASYCLKGSSPNFASIIKGIEVS